MATEFTVTVKTADWLKDPNKRWNAGLLMAGNMWRAENQDYPAQAAGSTYKRTGALGNKSNFDIVEEGVEMKLKAVRYWVYPMRGTGIFGPKGTPITPKNGKILAWRATLGPQAGKWIVARSAKGFIWEGKLERMIEKIKQAFRLGIRRYKE